MIDDTGVKVRDRDHIYPRTPSQSQSQTRWLLSSSVFLPSALTYGVSSFRLPLHMPCSEAPTLNSPWDSVLSSTAWCSAQRDDIGWRWRFLEWTVELRASYKCIEDPEKLLC